MSKSKSSYGWAQATKDIVVTSINRGQLPALGVICIVGIIVLRLPEAELLPLVKLAAEALRKGEYISYPALIAVSAGWIVHVRIIRRNYSAEYERIGLEKSTLQGKLAGKSFLSSN